MENSKRIIVIASVDLINNNSCMSDLAEVCRCLGPKHCQRRLLLVTLAGVNSKRLVSLIRTWMRPSALLITPLRYDQPNFWAHLFYRLPVQRIRNISPSRPTTSLSMASSFSRDEECRTVLLRSLHCPRTLRYAHATHSKCVNRHSNGDAVVNETSDTMASVITPTSATTAVLRECVFERADLSTTTLDGNETFYNRRRGDSVEENGTLIL